ncbi:MAG: hypothetical protein ACRDJW_08115 [Thermomicrobiales bacterium]
MSAIRRRRTELWLIIVLIAAALTLSACGPEAMRARGGGLGADVDNRNDTTELHGEKDPQESIYHDTPRESPGE